MATFGNASTILRASCELSKCIEAKVKVPAPHQTAHYVACCTQLPCQFCYLLLCCKSSFDWHSTLALLQYAIAHRLQLAQRQQRPNLERKQQPNNPDASKILGLGSYTLAQLFQQRALKIVEAIPKVAILIAFPALSIRPNFLARAERQA